MCGICAYLGKKMAFGILFHGLQILQNRGYDSSGICTIIENDFVLSKFATTDDNNALEQLESDKQLHKGTIGISHTRWATHGPKTKVNAHPHNDMNNKISLVHNGIIENYKEIYDKLIQKGYTFISETDTEVISNLISSLLDEGFDMYDAITNATQILTGTWALVILNKDHPNKLYLAKNGSPLLVGFGIHNDFAIIASEQSVFSNHVNRYISLDDKEVMVIVKEDDIIKQFNPEKKETQDIELLKHKLMKTISQYISLSPEPYPHWTIKEIYEQPHSIINAYNAGGRLDGTSKVKLGGLDSKLELLLKIRNLIIIGCGTSLNAGRVGARFMRQMGCFDTIQVIDASEFESFYIPENSSNFGILCLSQSGETKDVISTVEICKEKGISIFSVVNVVGSCISHKSDCGVYLNSGREVGVAATKSFTSQCLVLSLISIWFAQNKGKSINIRTEMISNIRNLHININSVLDQYHKCKEISKKIMNAKSIFILGTKNTEAIASEGALKIKELSYIHAEGYPSAALKHGTFALIDEGTPIIFIKMGNNSSRIEISAAQTICRGALNILITDNDNFNKDYYQHVIKIPQNNSYSSILSIIPLQMIAYCLTILKNLNPDRPKNLAKTVTTL